MSYDVKCYDLAKTFLQDAHADEEALSAELAQQIQDTIDNFIASEINRPD